MSGVLYGRRRKTADDDRAARRRHIVEAVDEEAYRRGRVVDSKHAREIIDASPRSLKVTYTEEAVADIV
jgi:hypothetical protein